MAKKYGYEIESCGEPDFDDHLPSVSCLSQKDIDVLGLQDEIKLEAY